jgi:minor histocompatibility antigen H13
MDQLADVTLFCARRTIQCTPCNLCPHLRVSSPFLTVLFQSLISLAKFTLGRSYWNEFTRVSLQFKAFRNGERRSFQFSSNQAHHVQEHIHVACRSPSTLLIPLGIAPSALYIFYYGPEKPILLTNILALSFGHDAMSMLKVDSFRTGTILLSGLFLYDIWWVFGTKVVCNILHSLYQIPRGR